MSSLYGIEEGLAMRIVEGIEIFNVTGYIGARMLTELGASTFPAHDARALSRYCEDLDISSMFHFTPLPLSLRTAQLRAIRNKLTIMESDTTEAELCSLSEVLFCLTCMSFKAFVVDRGSKSNVACGFVGIPNVVYDSFRSKLQCRQCTVSSRLFRFEMIGMAVRVGTHTHILCTDCSSITILDPFAYVGSEYVCRLCVTRRLQDTHRALSHLNECPVPSCARHPASDPTCSHIAVTDDTNGGVPRVVAFCRQHRYLANRVARSTTIFSELLAGIDDCMKDAARAPSRTHARTTGSAGISTSRRHPAFRHSGVLP
jgi:hypothetical protein